MTFEGVFTRVNPRLAEFFGRSPEEVRAHKFADLTHPDDIAASVALVGELKAGERESFALDKRYIHKSGKVLWAHSTVSLVRDPADGKPSRLIAIVEDISERRAAEERLRFQADMLDSVGEAVIATKPDGTLVYLNRYAESLYGWDKEEALGRNIVDLLVPEGAPHSRSQDAMTRLRGGERSSGEHLLRRRDGSTFHASSSATPLRNEQGEVEAIIGVSNDITERKRVQNQLAESEAQLRALTARLQRLREEERTRIAREIHDELGQMLTGLKMDLRWVEQRLETIADEALQPVAERIVASTELTDAVIRTVQAIAAELRPSVLDTLGLAPALEFEARRFQNRTGITCVVERPTEMQPLSADVNTALFRIYQECLTNVARHARASRVDVVLQARDGSVRLMVRDNGVGKPDLERAAAGSLGILGIRERVGLLNGEVSFSSQEGRGTTVDVRLPGQQLGGADEGSNC
jgi:PAS domain S-box-containing protein